MITQLVPDQGKLKPATRYAKAVHTLVTLGGVQDTTALPDSFPKGPNRVALNGAKKLMQELRPVVKELGLDISDAACANLTGILKSLNRQLKVSVEVESEVAETVEYRGYTIEVHKLAGKDPHGFTPLILKDGEPVHRINVRSKSPYISIEHFAKRAIDRFVVYGEWPAKQGIAIKAIGE